MTQSISTLSDSFSWRRTLSIWVIYKRPIIIQLSVSAALTLLCYLLLQRVYPNCTEEGFKTWCVFIGLLVSCMICLAPAAFTQRNDDILGQLPVRPIEKWLFHVLYCLVLIPGLIEIIWYGTHYICSLISPTMAECPVTGSGMLTKLGLDFSDNPTITAIMYGSLSQTLAYIVISLYAVMRARRQRILWMIVGPLSLGIVIGLVSGIFGAVLAIHNLSIGMNPEEMANPESLLISLLPVFIVLYSTLILLSAWLLWLTYRRMARGSIS